MDETGGGTPSPDNEGMDDDPPSPLFSPLKIQTGSKNDNNKVIPQTPIDNPGSSTQTPRLKVYPDGSTGPWVVFFRSINKPLNVISITRDLERKYSSVTEICKVRPNKLRVVVTNPKHANEIVGSEFFTREYRVYIPSRDVEIDGVVTEESLTREDLLNGAEGGFKNPSLQPVKILECKQLHSVSLVNGTKIYTPSSSFRVTFSGSTLPNHISIGRLRLPVRLFIPRIMNCLNCKQLGHTATYCSCKARCSKCGENHVDDFCEVEAVKCIHCGGSPHELSTCPTYKLRAEKLKRSLKERSKRSFADMLKKAEPIVSENLFVSLPTDESDSDASNVEFTMIQPGNSRKRRKTSSHRLSRKEQSASQVGMKQHKGSTGKKPKQVAPGADALNNEKEFPALPGTSKTPDASNLSPRTEQKKSDDPPASTSTKVTSQLPQNESGCGFFTVVEAIEFIFEMFEIPDSLRKFINSKLPKVRNFLQKLAERKPFIATLIDFDG